MHCLSLSNSRAAHYPSITVVLAGTSYLLPQRTPFLIEKRLVFMPSTGTTVGVGIGTGLLGSGLTYWVMSGTVSRLEGELATTQSVLSQWQSAYHRVDSERASWMSRCATAEAKLSMALSRERDYAKRIAQLEGDNARLRSPPASKQ